MKDTPRYLTEKEISKLTSISIQTLRNWRHRGQGSKYHKPSPRVVRYRLDELQQFMESAG
jgi:Helix-turn-helix domain